MSGPTQGKRQWSVLPLVVFADEPSPHPSRSDFVESCHWQKSKLPLAFGSLCFFDLLLGCGSLCSFCPTGNGWDLSSAEGLLLQPASLFRKASSDGCQDQPKASGNGQCSHWLCSQMNPSPIQPDQILLKVAIGRSPSSRWRLEASVSSISCWDVEASVSSVRLAMAGTCPASRACCCNQLHFPSNQAVTGVGTNPRQVAMVSAPIGCVRR